MIIVKMMGNIGNQLFIYAMARNLQLESKDDDLVIDLSGLETNYYVAEYKLTSCNLPKENISYDIKSVPVLHRLKYAVTTGIYHIEQYLFRKTMSDFQVPDWVTAGWSRLGCYFNFNRTFYEYPKTKRKYKYVYGYFQSSKYFESNSDTIRKELEISIPFNEYEAKLTNDMQNHNSVAVSIRTKRDKRYIDMGFIPDSFYYDGMKKIAEKIDNPVFYIFSDSIKKVKETMDFPYPVVYVEPRSIEDGIKLMYNCKHFVIANSTFSWWGAFLGKSKDKIVVMPTPWDRTERCLKDNDLLFDAEIIKIPIEFDGKAE